MSWSSRWKKVADHTHKSGVWWRIYVLRSDPHSGHLFSWGHPPGLKLTDEQAELANAIGRDICNKLNQATIDGRVSYLDQPWYHRARYKTDAEVRAEEQMEKIRF